MGLIKNRPGVDIHLGLSLQATLAHVPTSLMIGSLMGPERRFVELNEHWKFQFPVQKMDGRHHIIHMVDITRWFQEMFDLLTPKFVFYNIQLVILATGTQLPC